MSKNRRNNHDQPIHEGQFVPVDEADKEESGQPIPEMAPGTPEEKDMQKSIHIGPIAISFESREARKARRQAKKAEKAAKPKKGISVPVLVAGTVIAGTAIKEGAKLVMKAMDRAYPTSLPESSEDSDYSDGDSVNDGIEPVEDTQE